MKKVLVILSALVLVSCSSIEVTPGEAYKVRPGLVQLQMEGATYSCHEIHEYNSLSLMCRKNPVR